MKLGSGYDRTVRIARGWKRRRKGDPILDFFGHEIEIGDRYFYGSPPTAGVVVKLKSSSLVLVVGVDWNGANATMSCKSPEKGICIDKVTKGIEP